MSSPLSEMKLEELWALFPIFLAEHNNNWNEWYGEEAGRLSTFLPMENARLSHIGSTAIKGIWAKPIIDILLEIPEAASMEAVKDLLASNGYICMCKEPGRKDFNRGYTESGFAEKVFHLHLRFTGDNDELYFRDYMNDHTALAKQYETLKLSLWRKYEHDRDAYTNAKSDFIRKHTLSAKEEYGKRY